MQSVMRYSRHEQKWSTETRPGYNGPGHSKCPTCLGPIKQEMTLYESKEIYYLHGVAASVERLGLSKELCVVVQSTVTSVLSLI